MWEGEVGGWTGTIGVGRGRQQWEGGQWGGGNGEEETGGERGGNGEVGVERETGRGKGEEEKKGQKERGFHRWM